MATVLIVDDVLANRSSLAALLRDQGHRLLEAANGQEALSVARAEHPDLVITDVLMPVMDGYEFVRELRLDPTTSGIPVVFHTPHYGRREARQLAPSLGVCDVLTKPAEPEEILRVVRGALSSGAEARAFPYSEAPSSTLEFDYEHLRLHTDGLPEKSLDSRNANARLRALINIGLELASELDPDRLLQNVCDAARDLFGATYVTLGIVDLEDRTVQRVVTCGADVTQWIKAGSSVAGILRTVIAERRTLRGDNPGGDPAGLELPALHPQVRAFLAAPVASPARVYGWLCLVANEGRPFTEDDQDLVTALSGQIGRIYENGHFHAVAQRRAQQLELEVLERKQAECALRGERDLSKRYLDTAAVIVLALDLEGQVTLVNRYGSSVLGWTADELQGRDWVKTCIPSRVRDGHRQKLQDVVGGDRSIIESLVLTRAGEERLIEWRSTVLRDDAGQITGTLSSGADITERNQAVEALKTAEERMRFALQNANVGIWDVDYATGVNRWSETLETHYGLQPGTFGGTFEAFLECIHPEDRESVLATVAKAIASGADFSIEHRSVWPDGTVRWLTSVGRVQLGEHGEPVRGVGVSLDVTERHELEGQYQKAQRMEAIGRLAGGVAHDFNNLLTVIQGNCELLLGDLDSSDSRETDIAEIQKACASATGLTRQLMAFSRKQIIEPIMLDLNLLVADTRAMLGSLIKRDVKVVVACESEVAPVKADRTQVEQIVVNLAVNALDAMPRGGTLTIRTANIELDECSAKSHFSMKPGPYVLLTVSDTGTGMTPQVQARVFEPFFTTKQPDKGTGLGLATVHSIVTRIGGSVDVRSEVGRGTSFTVCLPRADAAEMTVEVPLPVSQPLRGAETVLVVEDADGLRGLARRLLQRQGYTVLVAANADEAIQMFDANASIDVLLTDVVMPGASGPELTRRLVERQSTLKVIYMSGYTEAEDALVQHGDSVPGIAFLHKPFTSEALGRKLREVLDRQDLPAPTTAS